jgi:hypothetical protein
MKYCIIEQDLKITLNRKKYIIFQESLQLLISGRNSHRGFGLNRNLCGFIGLKITGGKKVLPKKCPATIS